jgi:predicted AAA+ superfamily ATPase
MVSPVLYPRFAEARLVEALSDTPVVLVHGPRQCGKTTLAQQVGRKRGHAYFSFDDDATLAAATADPVGFVGELPDRVILDEVQRSPGLLTAIKSAVDRQRRPGRFILTGSANVLTLPTVADSLAGRMGVLRLHPLAQAELAGHASDFVDRLFAADFRARAAERLGPGLAERIAAGGYPAALARESTRRRATWYRDYVEALVQRDVRDLSRIGSLDALPRLMSLASGQTARLINVSDLASGFRLSRPTIRDYVTLLARMFLLEELPPWHTNRLKRLIKTPKLHVGDTGVCCALLGHDAAALWRDRTVFGQLLETFVFQELRRQASWRDEEVRFHHYRDKEDAEVDVVLERGAAEIAGVEVRASATVTASDFRGLRKLREAARSRFVAGVVLYDGEATLPFGDGLFAVPVRTLWESH